MTKERNLRLKRKRENKEMQNGKEKEKFVSGKILLWSMRVNFNEL